jgi:hypothetical protein
MKFFLKALAIILLIVVGLTALYGGWALMIDPSGEILQMPVTQLKLSPFENYFVPGAILFFALGWGSILVLPAVVLGKSNSHTFLILAGAVVSGWIIAQMIMLAQINWLHVIYISIGSALIFIGVKVKRFKI